MIVCPNCNHQNPDGAIQCEACYTPLPATTDCPNCGATVQTDASFCGQCGFSLSTTSPPGEGMTGAPISVPDIPDVPDLGTPDPLVQPEPVAISSQQPDPAPNRTGPPIPSPVSPIPATLVSQSSNVEAENVSSPDPAIVSPPPPSFASEPEKSQEASSTPPPAPIAFPVSSKTQLQLQSAALLHVQTNTRLELPLNLTVIHMGKPNDQIPPDIDVSGFPHSEIVSRIHADIRVEGDTYYIEDVGSSNGTYVNHTPLPRGNRHRLRSGDRISLGKGDQMTFLFQSS